MPKPGTLSKAHIVDTVTERGDEVGFRRPGKGMMFEGSVRKANNTVRINAQLIDAATGHHLWAERYDGNTSDIFALQDKITQKIAGSLAVRLTVDEKNRLAQKETNNMEAYEAYLKGSTSVLSIANIKILFKGVANGRTDN